MRFISKLLKGIVMTPIVICALPALIILYLAILVMETEEGPLRELVKLEIQAYGLTRGFGRFMQKIFIPSYSNNIQGFIIAGAGFLVVVVGLRSMGILPTEVVYVALTVEFTLLLIYGTLTYYTIDESKDVAGVKEISHSGDRQDVLSVHIKELNKQLGELTNRLRSAETKVEQIGPIDSTMKSIYGKLDIIVGEQSTVLQGRQASEKLALMMKELSEQFNLLESRLRSTEAKFQQFSQLDSSLQSVSKKLEMIAGDQFNLRVRQEFERLVTEMNSRIISERTQAR